MSDPKTDCTDLEHILKRRIQDQGPLTVAEYMDAALYHPEFGYYVSARPIGAAGDFITAPEISQMFGELIGLWSIQAWRDMGAPAHVQWIELGPGRGTLMQDALRAARQDHEFLAAVEICLVEKNAHLKDNQSQALSPFRAVKWFDDFAEIPEAPFVLIANEFFDCLPIHQFVFEHGTWRERLIGLDTSGQLAFLTGGKSIDAAEIANRSVSPQEGDILETNPTSQSIVTQIADRLQNAAGRALIIDYGHEGAQFGDTLQALSRHRFAEALRSPGKSDLTAHVDFAALAKTAEDANAVVHGPAEQGVFLSALGLEMRAKSLKSKATQSQALEISEAADRLTNPSRMGRLFKALCLSSPQLPAPPGFPAH